MNFDFTGSRWFLLLIAVVLPLILLVVALLLQAGLCYLLILLTWIGVALMVLFIPKSDE
jgi:hypothetical protein